MYSKKYDDILNFVESYGAISIDIAKDLYYNTKFGYDSSRRALSKLVSNGYLKTSKDFVSDKYIYYDKKAISSHKLILLRFYAKIVAWGGEILEFKREYKAINYISDGLIIYRYNGAIKIILVEVDINNKTKEEKYIKIYNSNYYQNTFGTFPRVFIIDKRAEQRDVKNKKIEQQKIKFIFLNYDFDSLGDFL